MVTAVMADGCSALAARAHGAATRDLMRLTPDNQAAVKALARALDIAPTYAQANYYMGLLQCEAGNWKEGRERARLAHDEAAVAPSLLHHHHVGAWREV